jgi:nucleotide-binding universal stress UspA family protein
VGALVLEKNRVKTSASDAVDQAFARHRERFLIRANHPACAGTLSWREFFRSHGLLGLETQPRQPSGNVGAAGEIVSSISRAKAAPELFINDIQPAHLGRIIVGHDLGCGGDRALESALVFAAQCNASIRLVHVVYPRHHFYPASLAASGQSGVEEVVSKAGRQLRRIVASYKAKHVRIDYDVRVGKPAMELILAGRAWQCDLIIIGGSTRQSIQFLKSTTERLIRMAFVPVLVARQPLKHWPQRFLIPTDFSPASRQAAEEGVALAKRFGGRVFFLHVFDPTPWYSCPYSDEMMGPVVIPELKPADLKREWTAFLQGLSLDSLTWHTRTEEGLPKTGIVRYADVTHADIIVMGAHGKTALEQMLIGSVTDAVVRAASCPVLTIKPGAVQCTLS